jgi:hypothetical protein
MYLLAYLPTTYFPIMVRSYLTITYFLPTCYGTLYLPT